MSNNTVNSTGTAQVSFWQRYKTPVLLTVVGGAIDTIGFITLFGFFTAHVTGNLVLAGSGLVKGEDGLWIKLASVPLFILTVVITKIYIDKSRRQQLILSHLLLAEAVFLLAFMIAGLYFQPFTDADSITVAITGGLGLTALAIRNTASKTVIKHMSPTVLMTGNTTQLGINLSDYLANRTSENAKKLGHSSALVLSFIVGALLGALLYVKLSYWAVGLFVLPVLYLSVVARKEGFLQNIG
ncbi:YoaK family protein [Psychrobacter jeotgali]|uniref:YoaK family protein n=1 Tax=Psychrobacter jeotgali TaxID=179010 RepID=UPI001918E35F|nr:YoaK family protein [Psychrobacter jeotgali]